VKLGGGIVIVGNGLWV